MVCGNDCSFIHFGVASEGAIKKTNNGIKIPFAMEKKKKKKKKKKKHQVFPSEKTRD
jgi:hypothetical protein